MKIESLDYRKKIHLYNSMKYIYKHPYFEISDLIDGLELSKPTVSKIIKELLNAGIISKTSSKQRYVTYKFDEYILILEEGTEI